MDEYTTKLVPMVEVVYKAIARSLNLKEDCFIKHEGKHESIAARCSMYARCPRPEHVLGVKPHSDGNLLTVFLAEKDVEGLQVLKDDQWFSVPVIPDALFINLGDLGEGKKIICRASFLVSNYFKFLYPSIGSGIQFSF